MDHNIAVLRRQVRSPRQTQRNYMHFGRATLAIAIITAAAPACADLERKVLCMSGNMVEAACEGVLSRLDEDLFRRRWPAQHAIVVVTQSVRSKYAPIFVTTGMLQVVKVVGDGKQYGTKPVWVFQASFETNNLSDGAPEDLAAKNIGFTLANELNKAIRSGATDGKS